MSKVFIVRLSRYSIYKVQFFACRSRGELVHTSTSHSVCQELFSSFLKLFKRTCRCFRLPVARRQLCYVSTSTSVCQELFSSFFKFLLMCLLSCGQLAHISTAASVCQVQIYKILHLFPFSIDKVKEPPKRLLPSIYYKMYDTVYSASSISP